MKMLKSTHLIKTKNTFIDCTGRTREPKYDDCSWKTPGNEKTLMVWNVQCKTHTLIR
jgi:hypothetical protein